MYDLFSQSDDIKPWCSEALKTGKKNQNPRGRRTRIMRDSFRERDSGQITVALAKHCFFGEQALTAATVYGKTGKHSQKLKKLKAAIEQTLPFQNKTTSGVETLWKA